MGGISGFESLDAMIEALDPAGLVEDLKSAGADAIQAKAGEQYATGRGPSDAVMPPRKKDGAKPLRRPLGTVRFIETSTGIAAIAEPVLDYHLERRAWRPEQGEVSAPWAKAADAAMEKALEERLKKAE